MFENKHIRSLDRYFRSEKTIFAKALKKRCSLKGKEYRQSQLKKDFERPIRQAMRLVSHPVVLYLANQAKKESGGDGYYYTTRVGKDGIQFKAKKIQTMVDGSDSDKLAALYLAAQHKLDDHPNNTRFGSRIRPFELDELPQLNQPELALVGIRASSPETFIYIRHQCGDDAAAKWEADYKISEPGIAHLAALVSPNRKDDKYRPRPDYFYAENACTNLDAYILIRTSLYMIDKILTKVSQRFSHHHAILTR